MKQLNYTGDFLTFFKVFQAFAPNGGGMLWRDGKGVMVTHDKGPMPPCKIDLETLEVVVY